MTVLIHVVKELYLKPHIMVDFKKIDFPYTDGALNTGGCINARNCTSYTHTCCLENSYGSAFTVTLHLKLN